MTYGVQSFLTALPLLGSWEKVTDLESPFIQAAADRSLQLHEADNVGGKAERLSKILDGYSQVWCLYFVS